MCNIIFNKKNLHLKSLKFLHLKMFYFPFFMQNKFGAKDNCVFLFFDVSFGINCSLTVYFMQLDLIIYTDDFFLVVY